MSQSHKIKRNLIEGHPALIDIDIQAETYYDRTDEAIPSMPDYTDRTDAEAVSPGQVAIPVIKPHRRPCYE